MQNLAKRMRRRWRVVPLRSKGETLGEIEVLDAEAAAVAAAAVRFGCPGNGMPSVLIWIILDELRQPNSPPTRAVIAMSSYQAALGLPTEWSRRRQMLGLPACQVRATKNRSQATLT